MAFRRAELRQLLAQVREPPAVGSAVAPTNALHRRHLDLSWQQPRRSHSLLGAAVDDGSDPPPTGWGPPQAAEAPIDSKRTFHRERAQGLLVQQLQVGLDPPIDRRPRLGASCPTG